MKKEIKSDKDKLIESNENKKTLLNVCAPNPTLERTMQRNKSLELFVNRSEKYLKRNDQEKDKYFKLYVDNYKLPENKSFVNKKIESKHVYCKSIEEQIKKKKEASLAQKEKEEKAFTEINEQILKTIKKEENERKVKESNLRSAYSEGNRLLISLKKSREEVRARYSYRKRKGLRQHRNLKILSRIKASLLRTKKID